MRLRLIGMVVAISVLWTAGEVNAQKATTQAAQSGGNGCQVYCYTQQCPGGPGHYTVSTMDSTTIADEGLVQHGCFVGLGTCGAHLSCAGGFSLGDLVDDVKRQNGPELMRTIEKFGEYLTVNMERMAIQIHSCVDENLIIAHVPLRDVQVAFLMEGELRQFALAMDQLGLNRSD